MSHGARWVAAGASLTLACSLFTSLGDLKRDDDPCATCAEAGTIEAGIDAKSDVGASTDADVNDSAIRDTGGDVRIDAARPPPFCASLVPQPALCEDFDTGPFSARFSSIHTTPGATLRADSTAFVSPDNALLVSLPAAGNGNLAYLKRAFLGTATVMSIAFDLRVDSWVTGGSSGVVASIVLDDGGPTQHALALYVTDAYAAIGEVFGSAPNQLVNHKFTGAHPLLGTWVRVKFQINVAAHVCSASLDGVSALNASLDATWAAGAPTANVGVTYAVSQSSVWAFRYDNVVIDWK